MYDCFILQETNAKLSKLRLQAKAKAAKETKAAKKSAAAEETTEQVQNVNKYFIMNIYNIMETVLLFHYFLLAMKKIKHIIIKY